MAVDITAEVLVKCSRERVAAFMFEPRNDAIWTTGVVEATPEQPGPLETGKAVIRVSKFKLAAPLLGKMVKRSTQDDLENLRTYLEAGGDGTSEDDRPPA